MTDLCAKLLRRSLGGIFPALRRTFAKLTACGVLMTSLMVGPSNPSYGSGLAEPSRNDEPASRVASSKLWLEDRSIQFAIRSMNHGRGQFYFKFGDDDRFCSLMPDNKEFYDSILFYPWRVVIHFDAWAVVHDVSEIKVGTRSLLLEEAVTRDGYRAMIRGPGCQMTLRFEKLLKVGGLWLVQEPSETLPDGPELMDDSGRLWPEISMNVEELEFRYGEASEKPCPFGGGNVGLFTNAFVSEFGTKFHGTITRGAGSEFSRTFLFTLGDCRYVLSASMEKLSEDHRLISIPAENFDLEEYNPSR